MKRPAVLVGASAVLGVLALACAIAFGLRGMLSSGAGSAEREATADGTQVASVPPFALERWGSGLPRAGQWRDGFVVVDFDGDGQLDVVHGPARNSHDRTPQIFAGDGAGHFKRDMRYTFPKLAYDYGDVAVADFDGDGAPDLAVASHAVGIAVLVRRGAAFEPYGTAIGLLGAADQGAATHSALGDFSSSALEVADWNHDGRIDLIAASDTPRAIEAVSPRMRGRRNIVALLGKPDGFAPLFPITDVRAHGNSLAIGDIDPAPGLELVAASNAADSKFVLYRVSEAGIILTELPGAPAGRTVRVVALVPGRGGARVALGGMALGEQGLEGSLDIVRAGAAPTSTRLYTGARMRAVSAVGAGDLDADGVTDLVIGEEDGTLRVFLGARERFVSAGVIAPEPQLAGCSVYGIVFADLDGRAGDEIVVSYAGDDGACTSSGAIEVLHHP